MNDILKPTSEQQRELFDRFRKSASGFATEDVIGAALNILVNGIRQAHGTSAKAQASLDEKTARAKSILAAGYDAAGNRMASKPAPQILHVSHFVDSDKIN